MKLLPRASLAAVAALAAVAWGTGPANAGKLTVVRGDSAQRVEDPLTPSQSQVERPRRSALVAVASSAAGRRAVRRALRKARRARRLSGARSRKYWRIYRKARSVRRRLRGARGRQLGYVIASLEGIALRGRLTAGRMRQLFVQLQRNTRYWPSKPFPGSGDFVSFGRSEVLYRYFPGKGLQLHPLGTFKRANLIHGACKGVVNARCSRTRLRRLLDEMKRYAVRRGRGWIAWEYMFHFGGGSPPWMSGMAQATGIQALGRASVLLGRPDYARTARKALGAFDSRAPVGVRTRGFRGGVHYLQYSFAPRTYIYNAFIQALVGLYDFGKDADDVRARRLFERAKPEAEAEIPFSDLGDWSMYSYRGSVSDRNYHELLREVLQSMCTRRLGEIFCTYAKRYRRYQTEPPKIEITGPDTAAEGQLTRIRFTLSKLSAVELKIYRDGRLGMDEIATFRRGSGSFRWRPRSSGTYTVRLGAKELRTGRGLKGRDSATIEVN